jgi:hypothetical protein
MHKTHTHAAAFKRLPAAKTGRDWLAGEGRFFGRILASGMRGGPSVGLCVCVCVCVFTFQTLT